MAFGISRGELERWKQQVKEGRIAFLTHYWIDSRFPGITSVTKVGCSDLTKLRKWAISHGLPPQYIHNREQFPHYDIFGETQIRILRKERQWDQLYRFVIKKKDDQAATGPTLRP